MKKFAKVMCAALLAGGALVAVSAPASARVSVGIGLGGGYYGPPAPSYSCDPYSRWYDPYRCGGYGYYGDPYYGWGGPGVVIGGSFGGHGWHGGGFHGGGFHGGGHHR